MVQKKRKKTEDPMLPILAKPGAWKLFGHFARYVALSQPKIEQTVDLTTGETIDIPGHQRRLAPLRDSSFPTSHPSQRSQLSERAFAVHAGAPLGSLCPPPTPPWPHVQNPAPPTSPFFFLNDPPPPELSPLPLPAALPIGAPRRSACPTRAPEPVRAGSPGRSCTQHSSCCSLSTVVCPLPVSIPRTRTVRWSRDCTMA